MSDSLIERILHELSQPEADLLASLQRYHTESLSKLWQQDARLYRAFGKALVGIGQPTMAFELVREGLLHHPNDHDLMYVSAFALARGRNSQKAEEFVHELLQIPDLETRLRIDSLSLAGRLKKDRYQACTPEKRSQRALESAQLYESAYHICGDSFPAINAATMSLLAGQPQDKVRYLAQAALRAATAQRQEPGKGEDYWLLATLGEAHLLLGDLPQAKQWYAQAAQGAAKRLGDLGAMRRQVQLLLPRLSAAKEILDLFHVGIVVAFVGHMLDRPGLPTAEPTRMRFPPDPRLEERVREAIGAELDRLNPAVGYCCGACGADLIFAELMIERHKELHLVLPFAKKDFYSMSVDFGVEAMRDYRRRFDAVVEHAQIHYSTEENYMGEEGLLDFVISFAQGLVILRAAELGVEPWTLAVIDPASPARRGGTRQFLERWEDRDRKSRVIDLAKLRIAAPLQLPSWWETAKPAPMAPPGKLRREVKVMLFADVKNYSKLTDQQAPAFFVEFLGEVSRAIRAIAKHPAMCNTWGDGLFLVFDHVTDAADFAMHLMDRIQQMDFAKIGLPADTTVRVGLHAGPVYPQWDQLIGRLNFFGTHVNRAARIEPKTPPGCVYASEQFAALLATEPAHDFVCEYAGVYTLGKEHDQFRCVLYRLRRREE